MLEMPRMPVDDAARERIRHGLDATLFVTAGAGSGKTRELVQRITSLVRSGVPLNRIAAITFTNSAAAELRDRVRGELDTLADDPASLTPAEVEHLENALASIDASSIQTLHSFAQRLVGLFPLEAGLPPEFEVRDEVAASIAFEDRWQPFVERLLADGAGDPQVATALLHGSNAGLKLSHVRAIAKAFHREWDRVLDYEFECPPMPRLDLTEFLDALGNAVAQLPEIMPGKEETDLAYRPLKRMEQPYLLLKNAWQELLETPQDNRLGVEDRIYWLLNNFAFKRKITFGQRANWRGSAKDVIRAETAHAIDLRDGINDGVRQACLGPILAVAQRFTREYRDARISDGSLEFHDVLILARDLLLRQPDVRGKLRARYDAILIDEFQDTDPLQVEIAVLLAADRMPIGMFDWQAAPVPPGRLFFVGDPKQSIYRFRRADIDLYSDAATRFGSEPFGETVHLTQNFRSAPSLIAWVNHVFGRLFGIERTDSRAPMGAEQVSFDALEAWREETVPGQTNVRLLGFPLPRTVTSEREKWRQEKMDVAKVRRLEARGIAALINGIREGSDEWLVEDAGARRPARLADVAILMPTRVALPDIEQALSEHGIPCRVESRSLLFETQEVRDLLIILAAIDDPTDQVAVVGALRSPGFGCSDADLYRYSAGGGAWNYLLPVPETIPANNPVALAVESLRDLHARRWWLGIGAMVDAVVRERRLLQVAFAARRPRETWQRFRFVHDQARAFTSAGGRSLRQFVQFMERQADEQSRVNERAVTDEDDDAVRIMTIHASKGLEFPIVIMAGLNTRENPIPPTLLTSPGGSVEVRVGSKDLGAFQTSRYAELQGREILMERIEDDRLLYVAATRARDHLVASVFHVRSADGGKASHDSRHADSRCSPAECLYELSHERPELFQPIVVEAIEPAAPRAWPTVHLDTPDDYERWKQDREALFDRQLRAPVIAATALAKLGRVPGDLEIADKDYEQPDEAAPWRKGRAATSLGRAVHAVLQTIDLATGAGIADAARAQAIAEGISGRVDEVAALAESARGSNAVRAALESGRYWREVYVATEIDGVTIEGFIDLLYESPEGFVVVDYKTDAARDEAAVDAAMASYRLQGAAYSLALQESLGRPVSACTFVFIRPVLERNIADLPGAMLEARAMLPAAIRTVVQPRASVAPPALLPAQPSEPRLGKPAESRPVAPPEARPRNETMLPVSPLESAVTLEVPAPAAPKKGKQLSLFD